ncbi:MAG: helix-turn-helix domain-containing protein [Bacteriovoracia bacterium]
MAVKKSSSLGILHPLRALGIAEVGRGAVRAEKLEERLSPRVPFPHKHDFFQILLIQSGSGWHEIDFRRLKVEAGKIFVMKPGQVHSWQLGKNTKGYVIEFTGESLREKGPLLQWLRGSADSLQVSGANRKKILSLAEEMLAEFRDRPSLFELANENFLRILLIALGRSSTSPRMPEVSAETERFQELVESHFHHEHSVEFYARKLGVSAQVLTMRISRAVGAPPRRIIHDRILLEAKRILAHSEDPIADIGYALGFDDPNYFARFFRNNTKASPGKFRESLRKDR